ncbi:3'(2'),5'-bisphosphate nucleotidase [Salisaeta longa]|uniref:3'(2'),5'-bisphosphate nucleotidase n=1 Tax=Salisaeta longa TaxID=503170 RepID=UPI0003B65D08|nr:3'(2'),5'-bisphosphate nucleotidase [Salisaeta longa]
MPTYADERAVALRAVRAAATLCQTVQASIAGSVLEKDDRTPVTVADFGSQAVICKALRDAFPNDPIIAEEDSSALQTEANRSVREQVVARVRAQHPEATVDDVCAWIDYGNAGAYSDRFWTLDPIDGTKGFVRGDQYAIALALVVEGTPQVAALCCPNLPDDFDDPHAAGRTFVAVRGAGAYQKGLTEDAPLQPITASDTTDPAGGRFTDSFVSAHSAHDRAVSVGRRLGITEDPLRLDSQAKYAAVARGDADIYFRLPRPGSTYVEKIWDHAAGMLIVEAAGGTVTDMHGAPLDFTAAPLLEHNTGIVATNGAFHDRVLAALDADLSDE